MCLEMKHGEPEDKATDDRWIHQASKLLGTDIGHDSLYIRNQLPTFIRLESLVIGSKIGPKEDFIRCAYWGCSLTLADRYKMQPSAQSMRP